MHADKVGRGIPNLDLAYEIHEPRIGTLSWMKIMHSGITDVCPSASSLADR